MPYFPFKQDMKAKKILLGKDNAPRIRRKWGSRSGVIYGDKR
jgi:hypothetical protein